MSHKLTFVTGIVVLVVACTTRTPLRDLSPTAQRAIGEAAVVEVCGFHLDVESEITSHHRETRDVAMEYIEIASAAASEGELAKFFSTETLAACGPEAVEWGGVRAAMGDLMRRYGTESEMLEHLNQMSSPELFCELVPRMPDISRFRGPCETIAARTASQAPTE